MNNQNARQEIESMEAVVFARSTDAIYSEVEGEFVALNIDKGQCYGMDSICSSVWNLLETPQSLDDLCARLQSEYDVDADTCRTDVSQLLDSLVDEGLVVAQGQSAR